MKEEAEQVDEIYRSTSISLRDKIEDRINTARKQAGSNDPMIKKVGLAAIPHLNKRWDKADQRIRSRDDVDVHRRAAGSVLSPAMQRKIKVTNPSTDSSGEKMRAPAPSGLGTRNIGKIGHTRPKVTLAEDKDQ